MSRTLDPWWPKCLFFVVAVTLNTAAAELDQNAIRPERELFITAPTVVDSPRAQFPNEWSFGGLLQQLVAPEQAAVCVRNWLEDWCRPQSINEHIAPVRPGIVEKIILPWKARDGYDADCGDPWMPNLKNAPFRLLAIVNRMDLCASDVAESAKLIHAQWRSHGQEQKFLALLANVIPPPNPSMSTRSTLGFGYGGGGSSGSCGFAPEPSFGEGRLIFGAVDSDGQPLPGDWTIIFEYKIPSGRGRGVIDWAQTWHRLGFLEVSDPYYQDQLSALTKLFTHKVGVEKPRLAQIRTSEACFGPGREFRQFGLEGDRLVPQALSQTPAPAFGVKGSREAKLLGKFLVQQDRLIRSGIHAFPNQLFDRKGPVHILASHAEIPDRQPGFHWEPEGWISRDARRIFSLNTCNGCHAAETACDTGLHVHPRRAGEEAIRSTFLRTDGQPLRIDDPGVSGMKLQYREMEDRAAIFAALLEPRDRRRMKELRDVLKDRLRRSH